MVRRTTLNISLTEELQRLLDDKLASGRYGSASEVVRDGLRLIEQRDRLLAVKELRARIDIGWQQSERGEGRDGELVFAEMRNRLVNKLATQRCAKTTRRKLRMNPYELMPEAERDLSEIVDYIALDSPRNALKVFDKIHEAVQLLADMPTMGHRREDITDKPVRFWSVYKYLIVYRPDRVPMEVLRIMHGMRDLPRELRFDE